MQETTEFIRGVMAILLETQKMNPKIGKYQCHFISERPFLVEVSNGEIWISREAARDFEIQPQSITPDDIKTYANTFREKA